MKNRLNKIILFSILALSFSSCTKEWCGVEGVGPVRSQERIITNFNGVDLQLAGRVNLIQDSAFSVIVTTYSNYHPLINTYVRGGTLVVDSRKSLSDENVTIEIHLPSLEYLNIGGSGDIHTSSGFNSSYVKLNVSGSGKINFSGNVSDLDAVISGSGKIYLSGNSDNSKMRISGSGDIKGYAMICQNNEATISGSGEIETNVVDNLIARISGSGNINYIGYPSVQTHISGSGNVNHHN
ncbi:MAG: DUF2807 domain-containing protein [Bacteroidetes bacterium]|nr:DUF2807 domain-containing protein [Bacteroidota bacterium]MBK8364937.1 DUF2807 domain-containing protein [Bacteroidota bacterium]MBK9414305.1 DUF2807 domain-containing protein [Bacteroidota bacterium]MBL0030861.1 DUF2807 domain-containing protein [Bacteroidota bacterium]